MPSLGWRLSRHYPYVLHSLHIDLFTTYKTKIGTFTYDTALLIFDSDLSIVSQHLQNHLNFFENGDPNKNKN